MTSSWIYKYPPPASEQPEALRLAELLDCSVVVSDQQAAAELRRLHAQRDALLEALRDIGEFSLEQPTKAVARAAIATVEGETA